MPREPKAHLWEVRESVRAIQSFVDGRIGDDYAADLLLRSAVERQLQIVGEALNQYAKADADGARRIRDLPRIVAFRNILVHGYARIDDQRVWAVVHENLPPLLDIVESLLRDDEHP